MLTANHYPLSTIFVVLSLAAYALGLLSKEMAVTLPLLLILFDHSAATAQGRRFVFRRQAPVYAGYLLLLPAYLLFHQARFSYQMPDAISDPLSRVIGWLTFATNAAAAEAVRVVASPTASAAAILAADPLANLSTMAAVFADYVRLMVLPFSLNAEHVVSVVLRPWDPRALLSLAALAGFAGAAYAFRRRAPLAWFGAASFFVLLLPVSNIEPIYNLMAERYLYLPSVGFCLLMAWGLLRFIPHLSPPLKGEEARVGVAPSLFRGRLGWGIKMSFLSYAPAVAVMGLFSFVTIRQADVWRDDKTLWETTARRSPGAARAWYNLGHLAQADGRFEEAVRHYQKTLTLKPDYVEARMNLAVLRRGWAETDEAMQNYRVLLTQGPPSFAPYLNMANLLFEQGKWAEAVSLYKRIQERFPSDDAHPRDTVSLNLAKAYALLGRMEESKAHLDRVTPGKDVYAAYADVARTLRDMGRPEEAETYYLRILLDVEDPEVLTDLGVLCHRQGRLREAAAYFRRAVARDPRLSDHVRWIPPKTTARAAAYYNLGTVHSDLSELAAAEESLREAVRLRPKYADAWYNLAVVLQRQGRLDRAAETYERVIAIEPRRVEALNNLAGCHLLLGDLGKAEEYGRRALEADPSRSAPYVNLGQVHQRRGEWEKAVSFYQQAVRADPMDALAYNNLGACYLKLGDLEKAGQEFRSAIRANPAFADSYYHLGLVLERRQRRDEAVSAWKKTLSLNPAHPGALRALAAMKGK